jgi:hypothetical protein
MRLESVDICRNIETAEIADVQRDELTGLVCGLAEYYGWKKNNKPTVDGSGRKWFTVAGLYEDLKKDPLSSWPDLRQLVDLEKMTLAGFVASVGRMMRKHNGRVAVIRPEKINKETGDALPKITGKLILKTFNRKVYVRVVRSDDKPESSETT